MTTIELMKKLESEHPSIFKRITERKEAYWELRQSKDFEKAFYHEMRFFAYTTALIDVGVIKKHDRQTLMTFLQTEKI